MSTASDVSGRGFVERVARICAAAQEPLALLEKVATAVRATIPYDAAGWLLVDPDTLLMTGVYAENVPRDVHLALIEAELVDDDVNKFCDLATADVPVGTLSVATDGNLAGSSRWSRIYRDLGYGDELRTVFRSGPVAWGQACLTRAADRPHFTTDEAALMATIAPHVGNGLRSCLILDGIRTSADSAGLGMVVLNDDGSVESNSAEATRWLGALDDDQMATTVVLYEVAAQARRLAEAGVGPPARARTRLMSGEWLAVRGIRLSGEPPRTAVLLEPARRADVAPMLAQLHQLTAREQQVTQLLLQGMSTGAIARSLGITTDTLRGHVKAVFAKLNVGSRPELAALFTHEPSVRIGEDSRS